MLATISRQYREGNWSIYTEDVTSYWEQFLKICPFEFDKDNTEHRTYANGWITAKCIGVNSVHLMFDN